MLQCDHKITLISPRKNQYYKY